MLILSSQNCISSISTLDTICGKNKSTELGGGDVNERDKLVLLELQKKVHQHEQTISQLLKIVAATNKKMTELTMNQNNTAARRLLIK